MVQKGNSLWMALEATTERPGTRRAGDSKARAMSTQTSQEIAAAWAALPQHMRDALQQLIARDRPDTKGATITEIGVHELDAGEAEFDAERVAIVVLNTGHVRHELRSAPARVLLH
jgi:hypothetical protein